MRSWFAEGAWTLTFAVVAGGADEENALTAGDALAVSLKGKRLSVRITSDNNGKPFVSELLCPNLSAGVHAARVVWRGYHAALYVDEVLQDEEWPIGVLPKDATPAFGGCVSDVRMESGAAEEEQMEATLPFAAQYYAPPGHNTHAGDCMPFFQGGRYRLFHLFDRRQHRSKVGLGAHQWAQVSSADLETWTLHPIAVPITAQWEGSICTGSLLEHGGKVYAFYAVRMTDGSPAKITWATSDDCVHFEKSGIYLSLAAPFDPPSARDPMVFRAEDGAFHMLVTTSLAGTPNGGCLAHLVSGDLATWEQQFEPFLIPGYGDQPECADWFQWNGWTYLVFSDGAIGRYRMARSPFGPWHKPENDLLDALEVSVPKTAAFHGGRRLSTGFLTRRPRGYAGSAVTHELVQRADGTLGVRHVEEMLPPFAQTEPRSLTLEAEQGVAYAPIGSAGDFRLRMDISPRTGGAAYGLTLTDAGGGETCVLFDAPARMVRVIRPKQAFEGGEARNQLTNVDLSGPVSVDIVRIGDVLDLHLSGDCMLTVRLDEASTLEIAAFAQWSSVDIPRCTLSTR